MRRYSDCVISWNEVAICPTSSARRANSGSSRRALMLKLTFSAASDRRRIGPAMVRASRNEASSVAARATSARPRMLLRSSARISSISPGRVDSSSTPCTALRYWIGTATDTICSPLSVTSSIGVTEPFSARRTSG